MRCSLAMLNDTVARRGAVRVGLEHATLCTAEAASSMASGGYAAWGGERGCLAVSWVGGDCVCTRRGRRVVCGLRSRVALWRMLGTVGRGTSVAFLGALVGVFEAGLVERGR